MEVPTTPAAAPAATIVRPAAPEAAAKPGAYTVHLASYRNRDGALAGWQTLRRAAAPLAALEPTYRAVDLPGRGAFVRVTAGHFADKTAAASFCQTIKATVGYCQPLKG